MTNKEFLWSLGMEIKIARMRKGLSQRELAKLAGFGQGAITKLETGKADGKILTYKRVAESLGISMKDLL